MRHQSGDGLPIRRWSYHVCVCVCEYDTPRQRVKIWCIKMPALRAGTNDTYHASSTYIYIQFCYSRNKWFAFARCINKQFICHHWNICCPYHVYISFRSHTTDYNICTKHGWVSYKERICSSSGTPPDTPWPLWFRNCRRDKYEKKKNKNRNEEPLHLFYYYFEAWPSSSLSLSIFPVASRRYSSSGWMFFCCLHVPRLFIQQTDVQFNA